jgi:hypothetical protein
MPRPHNTDRYLCEWVGPFTYALGNAGQAWDLFLSPSLRLTLIGGSNPRHNNANRSARPDGLTFVAYL